MRECKQTIRMPPNRIHYRLKTATGGFLACNTVCPPPTERLNNAVPSSAWTVVSLRRSESTLSQQALELNHSRLDHNLSVTLHKDV